MIYKSTDPYLPHIMDDWKTGHYGEDYYSEDFIKCPVCNEEVDEVYYNYIYNEIVGCPQCVNLKTEV